MARDSRSSAVLGLELTARRNHVEEGRVRAGDRVGQSVVVGILGRDRCADVPACGRVLIDAAGSGFTRGKLRLVIRTHLAHRACHQRTAGRLAAVDHGRQLIGVVASGQTGVLVAQRAQVLGDDSGVAVEGVGDARRRGPVACVDREPVQDHLALSARRCQLRTSTELMAKLLPGLVAVAVEVYGQGRVLRGGSKVPGAVPGSVDPGVPCRPL